MGTEKFTLNYIAIRAELSSSKDPSGECLDEFLSIGLKFASDLIKEKKINLFGLEQQTEGFKEYLAEAVLWRTIKMYDEAIKNRIKGAESITLFAKLKDVVCEQLSFPKESLLESKLSGLFTECLDSFFNNEPSADVIAKMDLIGKFASEVVPNNPSRIVEPTRFIPD